MDFQAYLQQLSELDKLKRVKACVNSRLELAALCRREFTKDNGGHALLFEQVSNSPFSVAANLFGSAQRASLLLHSASFDHFSDKLKTLLQQKTGSVAERLRFTKTTENTFLTAQTDLQFDPDFALTNLPAIQSWPGEGGRYLNLSMALTQHPQTGRRNLGLYRAQLIDSARLALNFAPGSGAAEHLAVAAKEQQPLPISLILGSDPALLWVAAAPLPDGCDDFAFSRALFAPDLQLTVGFSQPLSVPADAEIVIEGQIMPGETATEGPFGNHSGQYVSRSDCPVMQVTAIRHRPQPVFPTTVVGPPPSENIYLAKANEILLRQMLKIDYPQIRDLQMPLETIFHGVALLAVKPQSQADNKELLYALWQMSPLSRSRLLVLLDEDINLSSASSSWWRTINCLQNQRIYQDNGRIAIDATGVTPSSLVVEDRQTRELLQRRRDEYAL
ncbi:MAG: UbiD family decarboxylase [Desulfuromusa sp.]|jgi:4-hydroxy-3-polyprenylbenzoate decarboxylase|nr:UbiD family decarboxylase [Desulfuromusa sp.]